MSIVKHVASHNFRYQKTVEYLRYRHQEDPDHGVYEPVLDDNGNLQARENCVLACLNPAGTEVAPETWWLSCVKTNRQYRKNLDPGDRTQHQYIISHPAEDRPLMTMEDLKAEGLAFARENLKGYDTLIAVHRDTDHDHIHIVINSVRAAQREPEVWMNRNDDGSVKRSEYVAGCKHQNSPALVRALNNWVMEYDRAHGLTVKDNNKIAEEHRQERYQEKNESLRRIFMDAASRSLTLEDLQDTLLKDHRINLICRGSTFSLFEPSHRKAVRLKTLGIDPQTIPALQPFLIRKNAERKQHLEQRSYLDWIQHRRQKNGQKAAELFDAAMAEVQKSLSGLPPLLRGDPIPALRLLIQKTVYLETDLQTELDKIDRLLDRWELYRQADTTPEDRSSHASYIQWCGADPNDDDALHNLCQERNVVEFQIQQSAAIREALVETAPNWWGHKQLDWDDRLLLTPEEQLRTKIQELKQNRKKLGQIAYNCQKAANRRIYNEEHLRKAEYFRKRWHQELEKERSARKELKQLLKSARKRKREIER